MVKSLPKNRIYYIVIAICILLNSSYALSTCFDSIPVISLIVAFVLMAVPYILSGRQKKVKTYGGIILLIVTFTVLSMILNGEVNVWGSYVRLIFLVYTAYVFTMVVSFDRFARYYIRLLDVMCIASFAMFICVNMLGLTEIFPTYENVNGVVYYSSFISFVLKHSPLRISGAFWEPGIFASFLIWGVMLELFYVKRKTLWWRVLLYSVAIVFTFSTAGYIILVAVFFLRLKQRQKIASSFILSVLTYVLLALVLLSLDTVISILADYLPDVFEKVTFRSNSMMTRVLGPQIDIDIWKTSLITGVGMGRYTRMWDNSVLSRLVDSRTSTVTYYFAALGIVGVFYVVLLFRGCFRQKKLRLDNRIILLIIINMILLKEPHNFNMLTYIFIGYLNHPSVQFFEERKELRVKNAVSAKVIVSGKKSVI